MVSLRAGLTAVLAATLLVSSCAGRAHDNSAPSTPSDAPVVTGEPAGHNSADITFSDTLIAHNQQAIEAALLVPSRSTDPDFVGFAATTASARRSELTVLKVMQVQWNSDQENPRSQPDPLTIKGMIDPSTIANLHALRGSPFETLWLQSMIGLAKASIDMANTEAANGKNVDAVDVAKQIAQERQAEIDTMTKMART